MTLKILYWRQIIFCYTTHITLYNIVGIAPTNTTILSLWKRRRRKDEIDISFKKHKFALTYISAMICIALAFPIYSYIDVPTSKTEESDGILIWKDDVQQKKKRRHSIYNIINPGIRVGFGAEEDEVFHAFLVMRKTVNNNIWALVS